MSREIKVNEDAFNTFIDKFNEAFGYFDEIDIEKEFDSINFENNVGDYSCYDDPVSNLISSIITLIKSIKDDKNTLYDAIYKSYQSYLEKKNFLNEEASKLTDSTSVNIDNSSAFALSSGLSSGSVVISGESVSSNSGKSAFSNSDSKMKNINVDDLIIDMLTSFGVTKDNFGSILKSEKNVYVVSMKNSNNDGNWNATDIKEYYIKGGKVIGVLTGNDTYIKVEDGKLIIDETNKSIYSSAFVTGVGGAGSFFATKSNYNTESNKEIFKKFYPNATDEEFNNFCDSIEKNGKKYEDVSQKLIESNKENIVNILEKKEKNILIIEDNAIKIDYKPISTELYAYASSKQEIRYTDGITNELVFNESIATDLVEYLKNNYSIDFDISKFSAID